jgi:hypothetical protein
MSLIFPTKSDKGREMIKDWELKQRQIAERGGSLSPKFLGNEELTRIITQGGSGYLNTERSGSMR